MKSSKIFLAGTAAFAAVILAGAYNAAQAYRGDYTQKGPDYSEERHQIMEQAFEGSDYNKWKEQMNSRGRVKDVITEENFSRFAEAHQLAKEGKYDEADQIRKELGLRTRNGEKVGAGYGKGRGNSEGRGQGYGRISNENSGQN